eukprot:TRINITY_DN5097_c0_g2_i5.p2 TRINITY_DN5097_c0_g2~~TRINITY_DN5097_c0_g2_i5.p2  ORF type:complete len:192 (+),score=65.36 TRINITY_DN5097_c0_g2_i5:36-611(+)
MIYVILIYFLLMTRRPPRSTLSSSSAASDVYKRQLQDQPILNPNNKMDYEVNDEPDILENVGMKEKEEFEFNQRMKEEIKQKKLGGAYNYEDKFQQEKKLLPQYDEERPQKSGIFLDDQGEYDAQKIERIKQIKNKLLKKNTNEIQLYQDRKIQSEYYDEKEERKFKVPIQKKIQKKRKFKETCRYSRGKC